MLSVGLDDKQRVISKGFVPMEENTLTPAVFGKKFCKTLL